MNHPSVFDELSVAQLRLFAAVVEKQSFSAAAKARGLSQPAVSRAVASMERSLGGALFSRTTRLVRPTSLGLTLYEQLSPLLEQLEQLEGLSQAQTTSLSGRLSVAAPGAFGRRFVAPVVERFLAAHPDVAVELSLVDKKVDLVAAGVDLAIRVGDASTSHGKTKVIAHSPNVFVGAPSLLGERRTAAEALALPVALPPGVPTRVLAALTGGARLNVRYVVDDLEALHAAVLGGLAVSLLPRWLVGREVTVGRLRALGAPPVPPAPVRLVFPVAARRVTRAFADAVTQELARQLSP